LAENRITLLLGTVPEDIRRAAHEAATVGVNDEVVGVLARHYGVPFTPTGKQGPPDSFRPGERKMMLRVPPKLDKRILQDAVRKNTNKTTLVCTILGEHYGTGYEPRSARRSPIGGGRRREPATA
jgi:hypothetical protein